MTQSPPKTQTLQREWHIQWSYWQDEQKFLFEEWITPFPLSGFHDKTVMDAGCGPGHHIRHVAPLAGAVVGVDLNTPDLARHFLSEFDNVTIYQGDLAQFRPPEPVDVLYCVGVIHHTDDPDATFANLKQCVKPGGTIIIWCYSKEGNALVEYGVEPVRKLLLRRLPRPLIAGLSWVLTLLMYPIIYTVYLLPLTSLPFYEYFQNWRRLSPRRNMMNVFDKLNAPQTDFISRERIGRWFNDADFTDVTITPYKGVSYTGVGTRR